MITVAYIVYILVALTFSFTVPFNIFWGFVLAIVLDCLLENVW